MFRISTRAWVRSIIEHTSNYSKVNHVVALQCRHESTTATTTASSSTPRPDYKRGQYGYAPGFEPPKGSQRAPPLAKPARTLDDLPPPSKRRVPQGFASQRRAAMTKMRHEYARQVLAAEIDRREAGKIRQQCELERAQRAKSRSPTDTTTTTTSFTAAAEEETPTISDPHHPEAILNVPKGIFSPDTGMPLRQPKRIDIDTSEKRRSRRLVRMARQSRIRSDALIELFHRSVDFVTEANLEAKIDNFFNNPEQLRAYTLSDLITNHRDMSNTIDDMEGRKRLDQLKRVLDGTSIDGKVGAEAVNDWQTRQSQTASSV